MDSNKNYSGNRYYVNGTFGEKLRFVLGLLVEIFAGNRDKINTIQ